MSRPDAAFLAWDSFFVTMGPSLWDDASWRRLPLDWQPAQIRNCSYAPAARRVGITAADPARGDQCLSVFDLEVNATIARFGFETVLEHALSPDGSRAAMVMGRRGELSADLAVIDLDSGERTDVLTGNVYQASTLSWFPDGQRIAFQSVQEAVSVVDLATRDVTTLASGGAPAVAPDGSRIAFLRQGNLLVWDLATGRETPVDTGRRRILTGLSWSPDCRELTYGVTAGVVGKEARFLLLDPETGTRHELPIRYQTGLILIPGDGRGD